jgi:hypothetical protein
MQAGSGTHSGETPVEIPASLRRYPLFPPPRYGRIRFSRRIQIERWADPPALLTILGLEMGQPSMIGLDPRWTGPVMFFLGTLLNFSLNLQLVK